jgi:UPF0716 family protein affecting phage T7 exclusion
MGTRENFERQGFGWRVMGFTKTHVLGVMLTEGALVTVGAICMVAAFLRAGSEATNLLLWALCFFAAGIGVQLSSVLSLFFYMGSEPRQQTEEKTP